MSDEDEEMKMYLLFESVFEPKMIQTRDLWTVII